MSGRSLLPKSLKGQYTSQPVNRPLFKLLESDVGGRGIAVEVQARGVVGIFVLRGGELLLAMVDNVASLWVDAIVLLPQHDGRDVMDKVDENLGIWPTENSRR